MQNLFLKSIRGCFNNKLFKVKDVFIPANVNLETAKLNGLTRISLTRYVDDKGNTSISLLKISNRFREKRILYTKYNRGKHMNYNKKTTNQQNNEHCWKTNNNVTYIETIYFKIKRHKNIVWHNQIIEKRYVCLSFNIVDDVLTVITTKSTKTHQ